MRIFTKTLRKKYGTFEKMERYNCSNSAFENGMAFLINLFSDPTEVAILA